MSDTLLGGNWTIYPSTDNNRKQVTWTGSSDGTNTCNALYSALRAWEDDPANMSELAVMRADTPNIYRFQNQWFIDDTSVEHLTGGSVFSDGWVDGTDEHVLIIGYAPTTEFSTADIGRTIRSGGAGNDTGTILDFNTIRNLLWIRPDDPTVSTGDEFDDGAATYTIGAALNGDPVTSVMAEEDGTGFTEYTTEANEGTTENDVVCFPSTSSINDAFAIGFEQPFSRLVIDRVGGQVGTDGGSLATQWQYSTGSDAWSPLAGVVDDTASGGLFGAAALADGDEVTWDIPTDWQTASINGSPQLYWVRVEITAGLYTAATQPLLAQIWISGVGAGAFDSHNRHGVGAKAGESAWAGITTKGTVEPNTHIYISQEDPDLIAGDSKEVSVVATKGTSDWWSDGQLDLLLKVKEADNVFGPLPNSSPTTAVATVFARQYTKTYSHTIETGLATAGGNTVAPLSTGDDGDNPAGARNLIWDNGDATLTLVDEELLYNVGSAGAGNLVAGVQDNGGVFTDDTTDLNSVATGDVPIYDAGGAGANDAFYFGMDNEFTFLLVDVGTGHNGTTSTQVWQYWDGSTWSALTVTDNTDAGNGALETAGRGLVSWLLPSDWERTNVENQPATAPTNLYYVRLIITVVGDMTTEPIVDTAWAAGNSQLKARVADTGIGTPGGATGDANYYLLGDPITDFANNDVVIAGTSRKNFDINGAPSNVGPAADASNLTVTFGQFTRDINENGTADPYSIDIGNATTLAVQNMYEWGKYLTRRGNTTALVTGGQEGQFYVGSELQIEYDTQTGGAFSEGDLIYDQTTEATGIVVADHDDGGDGDLIIRTLRGTFTAGNVLSDSPDPTQTVGSSGPGYVYTVEDTTFTITDESVDAGSAGGGDVPVFPATEQANDYIAVGAVKPFARVIFDISTQGVDGGTLDALWEYWNGSSWTTLEGATGFSDGTSDFTATTGNKNLDFYPPVDWRPRGLSDSTVNTPTLYFIRCRLVTADYSTNPVVQQVQIEDLVTANIVSVRAIPATVAAPFGTYPGASKWFMAPGMAPTPTELVTTEQQSFSTTDDNGNLRNPPNKQNMTVTNLIAGDTVAVYRRTGTDINKTQLTLAAGNNQSNTTLVMSGTIPADNPADANSKVWVISASGVEHRYRYASFASATFTLATGVTGGTSDGGSSTADVLHDTTGSPFTNAEVGDYVRNITEGKIGRISVVTDANTVTVVPVSGGAVTNWSGDSYDYNVLMEDYDSGANAFVPLIERVADAIQEQSTLTYGSDFNIRIDVRRNSATAILPFTQDSSFISTGRSIAAIRNPDTITT